MIAKIVLTVICSAFIQVFSAAKPPVKTGHEPKIVNIVNFIRLLEPRDPKITPEVLFKTVVKQVEIMDKYKLPGTFLVQYDALMNPKYQELLKKLPKERYEIGAWWEIPQPLVEKAGLKWRGRYPWDWRANIGFSTGYTPAERKKLIDVYMADFKNVFGYYPKSVASWFIDAYSINYMYEKYHIVASANCKDQYGTDGYTLWGGYWNQAYYPSKINSFMPAQHAGNQIPVPIFRLLGSDPIRQYDTGLSGGRQGVVTLEPVYPKAGGSETWINWFLNSFADEPSLGFNYTQAGQENSFTWDAMSKGFDLQMPLLAKLWKADKIRVETLATSGRWFKDKYKVTPATSFAVSKDIDGSDLKTLWFNSRYFRANLLWENGGLRVRDIHMFNEKLPSVYETQAATSNECQFFTLPVIDGYLWSTQNQLAGLRLMAVINGKIILLQGGTPVFTTTSATSMKVNWPLTSIKGNLEIDLTEKQLKIRLISGQKVKWYFDLKTAQGKQLPFTKILAQSASARFEDLDYEIKASKGVFSVPDNGSVFRISPVNESIILELASQ